MHHSKFDDCELDDFVDRETGGLYLFGYGSLIWKVDFDYETKFCGYVKNLERQFWLLSDDHRGTPENLGRVLTLVETDNESNRVYGLAYKLKSTNLKETFAKLNLREKCGYSLRKVSFHSHNESRSSAREPITCVCYFANSDNYYYSPHLDDNLLAMQIFKTAGPSGTNKEYLYNFCRKLNELFDEKEEILKYDSHIFQLEKLVRNLEITAE